MVKRVGQNGIEQIGIDQFDVELTGTGN